MTKAHRPPTHHQPTKMPVQLLAACNPHITTRAAPHQTTTAAARTPTNKASQAPTDRHRASTDPLKDNTGTEASRCSISRDRHLQVATTRTTGGLMVAVAEACSLGCALVWRAVVAWTACSRNVVVDKLSWID